MQRTYLHIAMLLVSSYIVLNVVSVDATVSGHTCHALTVACTRLLIFESSWSEQVQVVDAKAPTAGEPRP